MIFIVRRPQYFISHTTSQRSLVRRHRLARVNGNSSSEFGTPLTTAVSDSITRWFVPYLIK